MGNFPKGHKSAWGGAVIPPIPTRTETEQTLDACMFVPSQAPFTPAPIESYYIAATGMAGQAMKFIAGSKSAASCFSSNRWITKPGTAFVTAYCQVNAFTNAADVNDIKFDLYQYSNSGPGGVWNAAPVSIGIQTVAGLGAYKMVRFNFNFTVLGDCYLIVLERQVDTNTGIIYVPNILMYFNQALA